MGTLSVRLSESPDIRWFERHAKCRCGKSADGILRGDKNQSFGMHCQKCADRRIKASEAIRERRAREGGT